MTTAVQRRRGTNTEHASFTGLEGELSVNTTNESVHVHDGSTAGGFELARADASNIVATSIDINGGTIDGTAIGASSASTGAFTTLTASGEITANGGIALGDSDKATFGDSDDLQIYHDGSNSYISDQGTNDLKILATDFQLKNAADNEFMMTAVTDGAVTLYHNSAAKLATTSTGIDVTGTATMDGLTVDGAYTDVKFKTTQGRLDLWLTDTDTTEGQVRVRGDANNLVFITNTAERARLTSDGDLGIGTTAIMQDFGGGRTTLALKGTGTADYSTLQLGNYGTSSNGQIHGLINFYDGTTSVSRIQSVRASNTSDAHLAFYTAPSSGGITERARLTSDGNLLVGKTASGTANTGAELRNGSSNHAVIATSTSETPVVVNRKTNDGSLINFLKDGSTVGSIGTVSGDIRIGGLDDNHASLRFAASSKAVLPVKNSDGGLSDATTDLGASNARFKDLYLSGNAYLGDGKDLSWGGTYNDGNPTIAASSNFIAFYPEGTTSGEAARINSSGYITSLPTYNNGSASSANMVVNSSGLFLRSVSSGKYKTDVEDVQDSYVDSLLNIRPVYYRSLLENDNSEHSHWGFIAEEVAEIDPRLVHYKTVDVSYTDGGERVETELKTPEPEGVQYERFVPLMLKLIQNQQTLIESLTARIAALEE